MNNTDYLTASEVAEKKFPEGLKIPVPMVEELATLFNVLLTTAEAIDTIKKSLIYKGVDTANVLAVTLTPSQAEILHAVMGLVTETAEVVDALSPDLVVSDRLHLIEELGDIRWYEAILLRQLGTSADEVQAANIRKVSTRYPDKFDGLRAMNRDLEAERQSLSN